MVVNAHNRYGRDLRNGHAPLRVAAEQSLVCIVLAGLIGLMGGCASQKAAVSASSGQRFAVGDESKGPWWMQQTAMSRDGKLDLKSKSWWPQAAALKTGEQFMVPAPGEAAGRMLVRRESIQRRGGKADGIVWVIDDDGDGSAARGGDLYADCYVVDYGCDGVVDRMVDYIDDDGDKLPEEMDIRYFVDGELRSVWCGIDYDGDGQMWYLAGYEYGADFFKSDPYGNNMIYMNKYDPERGAWIPISECPFAFYDTDGNGHSDVVVRYSAVPIAYDTSIDPDYANDANRYRGPWVPELRQMGVVNVRYSFDVDKGGSKECPLHYEMGYNLVGATPYEFAGMERFCAHRRPPQVTIVTPYEKTCEISDHFAAKETGFSWHENVDDTIAIGGPPREDLDFRWEGVFWTWERRFMENTGGPNQKWNVRREWSRTPTNRRELYYSGVDRRIHLFGAEEGWTEVGHFAGLGPIGEIRMYDTDGNGYFDRWEVYKAGNTIPVRVVTVRDEKARKISSDYAQVCAFYKDTVLPDATAASSKLIAAMSKLCPRQLPEKLSEAMQSPVSPTYRRYAQDIACEMQFQELRRQYADKAEKVLRSAKMNDLRGLNAEQRKSTWNTQTAWQVIRLLERLDVAFGGGDVEQTCRLLSELEKFLATVKS